MGFRRKHSGGGGGGGGKGGMNQWMGFMAIIMGVVALLICLIMYGIALTNLDTAYTTAATYTEQVGLTDVMGIWPLVLFLLFMTLGLGAIGVGAYINVKKALGGGWMDIFLVIVMGTVTIVVAVLMNTTIQGQLHTTYVAANATVNLAKFQGLLSIMKIFGMVIFLGLMSSGIAPIAGAGYSGYKHLAGKAM